jgi:hypothetical protein
MMPPLPAESGVRGANTAPTPAQDTSPVYAPPQYYQPQVPSNLGQAMPPYQPPRKRSHVGWVLAFVGMGLFVALILGVVFAMKWARDNIPRGPGSSSRAEALSGESALNDATADQVTPATNETTLIKTFPLDEDATFSLKNVRGNITVEAWDKPQAQITVIKRGSESDRKSAQVYFKNDEHGLALRTAYQRGGDKSDVVFQIKLPRQVENVQLNTVNGDIKLSDVSGKITAQTVNGLVDLANVTSVNKAQSVNGDIKAVLKEAGSEPMEFKNVNGNIDLQIKGDLDANLEASAVRGSITIDDQFGVQVQKQIPGQKASGKIGDGGTPLKITTVNGSIKLSK